METNLYIHFLMLDVILIKRPLNYMMTQQIPPNIHHGSPPRIDQLRPRLQLRPQQDHIWALPLIRYRSLVHLEKYFEGDFTVCSSINHYIYLYVIFTHQVHCTRCWSGISPFFFEICRLYLVGVCKSRIQYILNVLGKLIYVSVGSPLSYDIHLFL